MLVEELAYMDDETLDGWALEARSEQFVQRIVDEYVRQYFEESTKGVAELLEREETPSKRQLRPTRPRRMIR